ncbi:MAG TPA: helix-turn-helix domain-containing protein [Alphaproteobacteria bacterium]|nr:helix-turn-helix domain-containing protein [Alphaproteobacteria bacterium]
MTRLDQLISENRQLLEQNARLQKQNENLQVRVDCLEAEFGWKPTPRSPFGLTTTEDIMFAALMKREAISLHGLGTLLLSADSENPNSTVKVYICQLRKKLRHFSIEIETMWGHGYRIPPASKAIARKHMEAQPI